MKRSINALIDVIIIYSVAFKVMDMPVYIIRLLEVREYILAIITTFLTVVLVCIGAICLNGLIKYVKEELYK